MKYQLNLTALSCPIPLLTAKKALANLALNDELVLQLNRQSAVENFVVFCEENQCELVDQHWLSEQIFEVCLKKSINSKILVVIAFIGFLLNAVLWYFTHTFNFSFYKENTMEAQSPMSTLFIFVIFGLIFYFMIYRPQAKRNKEHKKLMSELAKGTEVLTAGGLIGKITKVTEGAEIVIALNDTTEITINRNYIVSVLPKGSVKSL